MSATLNGQTVGFMLKERLGWDRPDVFPSTVELEHDCDRGKPYMVDGHVFYDRSTVRYVPERTCRVVSSKTYYGSFGCEEAGTLWTLSCGHEVINDSDYPPNYCIECGAKVVDS